MDGIASFYLHSILLSNEETSIIIIFVQVNYLYYNMLSKMPPGGGIPCEKQSRKIDQRDLLSLSPNARMKGPTPLKSSTRIASEI